MKTLVLRDETYAALMRHPGAAKLLAGQDPELPDAVELHVFVRANETPELFALTRSRMEAIADSGEAMRETMHGLILDAYDRGVGPAWLARWSGYDPSRIYQIIGARVT